MPRGGTFRRARTAGAPDVAERTTIADQLPEHRTHELPRAHVLGFLLQPHDIANGRVLGEYFAQRRAGERIELLDADDGHVLRRRVALAARQVHVDLPA